jgi:hypothetical protein
VRRIVAVNCSTGLECSFDVKKAAGDVYNEVDQVDDDVSSLETRVRKARKQLVKAVGLTAQSLDPNEDDADDS